MERTLKLELKAFSDDQSKTKLEISFDFLPALNSDSAGNSQTANIFADIIQLLSNYSNDGVQVQRPDGKIVPIVTDTQTPRIPVSKAELN